MYRKRIVNILINTVDLRKRFYESLSKRFNLFDYRYQSFEEEMDSWEIKKELLLVFQTKNE